MTHIPVCDHSHVKKKTTQNPPKNLTIYALKTNIAAPNLLLIFRTFERKKKKRKKKKLLLNKKKNKKNVQIRAGSCFTVAVFFFFFFFPVEQLFSPNPISPNTKGAGAAHFSPLIGFQSHQIIKKISSAQLSCKTQFVQEPLVKSQPHILFPAQRR